jgi:phosphoenolpyruvate synthase/pyruvate phosphate dikinase
VGISAPGGFSTTSHAHKELLDKGGINENVVDKLVDECIYEDMDKLMKVGMEIRDKVPDPSLMISKLVDVGVPAPGGFRTTSHAYKAFPDKGDVNEVVNDNLADASIYEDVDKLRKAGTEIIDQIMDPHLTIAQLVDVGVSVPGGFNTTSHAYKEFPDKGGFNDIFSDKLADESTYADVDKSMQLGTELSGKIMDPGVSVPGGFSTTPHAYKEFLDAGGINEVINDKLADASIYEDVDRLCKVGTEINDKIMEPPLTITQLVAVGVPVPGGFSITSHAYKEFTDKGGLNDIFNDKLADESTYADVDTYTKVGTEISDKIMDAPFQDQPVTSLAGRPETYSNVMGYADTKQKMYLVFASFFLNRMDHYHHNRGFEHEQGQPCATCPKLVRSETGPVGAPFPLDTASGFANVVFMPSACGLGLTVADGTASPDK